MAEAYPSDPREESGARNYESPSTARATPVANHEIVWLGISGAIVWLSIGSFFFVTLGYATTGWFSVYDATGRNETGLWEKCHCMREPDENNQRLYINIS